jgi:hypothetical protein
MKNKMFLPGFVNELGIKVKIEDTFIVINKSIKKGRYVSIKSTFQ